ncbi:MAG: DUF1016 family protein [Thermoleophilia bacterium]|nr:DUF1016 family protein [Thermoleophilia bacterium]
MKDKTPDGTAVNGYGNLLGDIKERIRSAQYTALRAVNRELIELYWDIGRMIVERQKGGIRGKEVTQKLAKDLQDEFPGIRGFSERNIWYMRKLYLTYAGNSKMQSLIADNGWTHNMVIMEKCKDDLQREFYIRMTRKMGWTVNVLTHQIENQTYEKTLLNQVNFDKNLPKKLRNQAKLAVKDEYTFDFLELGEEFSERKLERAAISRIEEMQFYLAVLDDTVRMEGENPAIGIILCRDKKRTIVEYALRESNKPIGVAAYRMVSALPDELQGQLPGPEQVALLMEEI